jgi:hypothetical protein
MRAHSPAVKKNSRGRPFQKGNPGRPVGAKNKKPAYLRNLVLAEGDELMKTLLEKAKEGEPFALRLAIEIIMGTRQERLLPGLDLPPIKSAADGPRVLAAIFKAVGAGLISPAEGEALSGLVDRTINAFAARDVEQRITSIETAVEEAKKQ